MSESKGIKLNVFNLIIGIVGGIVTIIASVGGSYVTTQVVLARHDERIKTNETNIDEIKIDNIETNKKVDKQLEILMEIRTSVAVIKERTENNR